MDRIGYGRGAACNSLQFCDRCRGRNEETNMMNMLIDPDSHISDLMFSHNATGSVGRWIPGISIREGGFLPYVEASKHAAGPSHVMEENRDDQVNQWHPNLHVSYSDPQHKGKQKINQWITVCWAWKLAILICPYRRPQLDPASDAQPDFHTHYSQSHLLDAALPAHKIFGIFDEALPISTRGCPKGSKNKKKPTLKIYSEATKGGRKRHTKTLIDLVDVDHKEDEGVRRRLNGMTRVRIFFLSQVWGD